MRNDLLLSLKSWFRAWVVILNKGLLHYFIYPILLNILLAMGVFTLLKEAIQALMQLLDPYFPRVPIENSGSWQLIKTIFSHLAYYFATVILWLTGFFTFLKTSKYLILACMSPVMSMLSERTEEIVTGKKAPFSIVQLLSDVLRGIVLSFRNLLLELFTVWIVMGFCLATGLVFPAAVPLLSIVSSAIVFIVGAYFYGFATMDYVNERRKLSVKQSIQRMRKWRWIAIGNGAIFSILFLIPFIGISIGTTTSTVAATLSTLEKEEQENR
ncbi:MAG: EI24 domain-containing protein [Crocinitomicaceae bacterium]|nr:EI24 domain-containing protein [Crocinitomicaceae bacterium]